MNRDLTMSQSFTNLLYHLIFSTKERRPLITIDYQLRLYDYIGGILRDTGGISLGINGTEDHVHVLAKLRPDLGLTPQALRFPSASRPFRGLKPEMKYAWLPSTRCEPPVWRRE